MNRPPGASAAWTHWRGKFRCAINGLFDSVRNQNSFHVHLPITAVVIFVAAVLDLDAWKWVALTFAITSVIVAELLNTAIELLLRRLHPDHDSAIGRALDASAAAVLVAAIGASVVGLIVLAPPLWSLVQRLHGG